ncbi:hypothetical protein EG68_12539 [Paragonimus skrjabini miyazakii]|uniref:Phosphomannose isomerase type I catalytic domain-containing protein n=1 Tax=Paragonimus skrjabini miyazakii TaxID=59628 RepID=A0A8S9YJU7_9TREM|nr:hypothetical protein EG68_12539 [Paragonimus skrjabini miyazakii]
MFKLRCAFQTYDWGKVGRSSTVFQLLKGSSLELELDDTKPYAELWFGTHPSGPSLLSDCPCMSLNNYISKFPKCLGAISEENFGRSLPFLLKVLSIEKALSIQAHPTKVNRSKISNVRFVVNIMLAHFLDVQ